jgi:hypothetical protein
LHHARNVTNVAGWDTTTPGQPDAAAAGAQPRANGSADGSVAPPASTTRRAQAPAVGPAAQPAAPQPAPPKPQQKKGLWGRILGVFK